VLPKAHPQRVLKFLKTVEAQTAKDKALHIIVDNYATHKHEKVRNWLKRNKRVTTAFHTDEFLMAESGGEVFGLLTERQLKRGVFTSVNELEQQINEYIKTINENPKPFVWTKSVGEICRGSVPDGRCRRGLSNCAYSPLELNTVEKFPPPIWAGSLPSTRTVW
jgi:hypothetical protein